MAFCCWPTLLQKITRELFSGLRKLVVNGERGKSEGEKIEREEKKERVEKLNSVQLVCLALAGRLPACLAKKKKEGCLGLVGNKEVKESGAACSKAERKREGRSKIRSFKGKVDDIVQRESRWT